MALWPAWSGMVPELVPSVSQEGPASFVAVQARAAVPEFHTGRLVLVAPSPDRLISKTRHGGVSTASRRIAGR